MTWVNQPRQWRSDGADLHVTTDEGSDFWRGTVSGVDQDSGHAFLAREKGDVAAEATVYADLSAPLDQAGLMIRLSGWYWVKFAVQAVRGAAYMAATSTRDGSDWSIHPLPGGGTSPVRLRLERTGGAVFLRCAVASELADAPGRRGIYAGTGLPDPWHLLRIVPFPGAVPVGIGPMCSSPMRGGLDVSFTACTLQTAGRNWVWH